MIIDNDRASRSNFKNDPPAWPQVSADKIGIPDFTSDLAYMGLYLKLEILNNSPYLVREAELRIDGTEPEGLVIGHAASTQPRSRRAS
jgi:hypothetical protein